MKQIYGFENYYIDETGNIYSNRGKLKTLNTRKGKNGYVYVDLWKNGKGYSKTVHRLVAETFIPNPDNKSEVNHKNGIKTDNNVENLEWVTRTENQRHSWKVLGRVGTWRGKLGKEHPSSKVVLQIEDGKVVNAFFGLHEAGRQTGLNYRHICDCCKGKLKKHGGFVWKYKDENDNI